jgi:hypothetical protein
MSIKIPCKFQSQINRFLCKYMDGPLKAFGCPSLSRRFSLEDVLTLEQHRSDARSCFSNFYTKLDFSRHYLESFCKTSGLRGNTSGHYLVFQNIMGFLYERGKDWQWRPSGRLDVVLFWEESRYSGKAVIEDHPDEYIFRPDAPQLEFEFV